MLYNITLQVPGCLPHDFLFKLLWAAGFKDVAPKPFSRQSNQQQTQTESQHLLVNTLLHSVAKESEGLDFGKISRKIDNVVQEYRQKVQQANFKKCIGRIQLFNTAVLLLLLICA